MKIGIVGLAGSGKSTIFEAVTGTPKERLQREAGKTHIATIAVPDNRLEALADIFKPKKLTHIEITFIDCHGYNVKSIKEVTALILVLGVFSGRDPLKDLDSIETDIILTDLDTIQTRLPRLEKELRSGKEDLKREKEVLVKCRAELEKEKVLSDLEFSPDEEKYLSGYQFLSKRPVMVVINVSETDMRKPLSQELRGYAVGKGMEIVEFCAQVEEEISELKEDERIDFLKEMGISESAKEKIIKASFKLLDLISFFTVKGNETRAWAVNKGASALEAAGKIHSDIKRGFIRAEVINFDKLKECGSISEAKNQGLLRLEGKEYIVQEGDIINFRFNV